MLSALFKRIATKRLEKKLKRYVDSASGPPLHRMAVAIARIELEDPWVSQVLAQYSEQEQPVFLMAYECFLLWIMIGVLKERLPQTELEDFTKRLSDAFAAFGGFDLVVFEKIWPCTGQLMPIALKGGGQTGAVYPLAEIIQAATSAGYPLSQIMDYRLGVHVLMVMKRIADAFE